MTTVNLTILSWLKNNSRKEKKIRGTVQNQSKCQCRLWVPAVAAFLLAALCSGFWFRAVMVQGISMEPTLHHNDWVISLPGAYWKASPERGDVVLIQRSSLTQGYIVKRVIALPGETVEICQGRVLINGESLEDPYMVSDPQENMPPILVEPGCCFVLGDNRTFSQDSRDWEEPMVHKEELRGKVWYSLFPKIANIQ